MKKKEIGIVAAIFFLITAFFFLPVFTKRQVPMPLNLLVSYYSPWRNEGYRAANKPIGFDDVRQIIPYMRFTSESLRRGELPLWNPYIFAGNPHLASIQTALFYPGTLLMLLLPLPDAWTVLVMIQPVLAGFFTYLFLKKLGLPKSASFLGAFFYAFSGWMITWWEEVLVVEHSILWLPLALYASLALWDQKRSGAILLTVSLVLSFFAGFTQSFLYLLVTVLLWNIWLWRTRRITRPLGTLAVSFFAAAMITAVQWMPTAEAYLLSRRASEDSSYLFSGFLLPLERIVTLFAPDYWGNPGTYNAFGLTGFYHERIIYLGLVPLFFALAAYVGCRKPHAVFWKWVTAVSFSLCFALPTSWLFYTLRIPLLSAMQPARIMMIATFGASVLAAYGWNEYLLRKNKTLLLFPGTVITLLAFAAWGWFAYAKLGSDLCFRQPDLPRLLCPPLTRETVRSLSAYSTTTFRNLLLPTATLLALLASAFLFIRRRTILFVLLLSIHLGSMWYFAHKYLYFSERKNLYPPSPVITELQKRAGVNRVWGYGEAAAESNILSYFDLATPEGYEPFFPKEFGELASAVTNRGQISDHIPRSDVTLKRTGEDEPMTGNPYRLRLMALLGVRYIMETRNSDRKASLQTDARFPPSLFATVWENDTWRIWEYKDALPRAYLVTDVRPAGGKRAAALLMDPLTDLSRTVIVDGTIALPKPEIPPKLSADIVSYRPTEVSITTRANTPALLFLSDSYYPGWHASVDGKPTRIYRADYAFRAVAVPEGTHTVRFSYRPDSLRFGVILSVGGIFILVLYAVVHRPAVTGGQNQKKRKRTG